jgi:hypothetical protein
LGVDQELSSVHKVFPVLVVNDEKLEDPLATHYLAKRLQERLGAESEQVKGHITYKRLAVVALSIVTIDMLEILEASSENFSLLDLLADFTSTYPDRLVSLNNFIFGSKYARQTMSNPRLARLLKEKMEPYRQMADLD